MTVSDIKPCACLLCKRYSRKHVRQKVSFSEIRTEKTQACWDKIKFSVKSRVEQMSVQTMSQHTVASKSLDSISFSMISVELLN
jgi:hypothetical protein